MPRGRKKKVVKKETPPAPAVEKVTDTKIEGDISVQKPVTE